MLHTQAKKTCRLEITEAHGLLIFGTDRLIKLCMKYWTWRGNNLTKLSRHAQLWVYPRFEPPTPYLCMIKYTGKEPVYRLSFIPSASYRSKSMTTLSPSQPLVQKHHQLDQETLERSRIATKAGSPVICITGCATIPTYGHYKQYFESVATLYRKK